MVGRAAAAKLESGHVGHQAASGGELTRSLSVDELVREIARRRHAVTHPLFFGSFLLFCITLLAFAYLPDLVSTRIFGSINVAYLLALAQFAITFLVAAAYAAWARSAIDPLTAQAREMLANLREGKRS